MSQTFKIINLLGAHIQWGAHSGAGLSYGNIVSYFSNAKIENFYYTSICDEQIRRFNVTMNNVFLVGIGQGIH